MCLAVPGQIVRIDASAALLRTGEVRFAGVTKRVNLGLVPEARIGDYVLVHVGFAIATIDERGAERVFDYLEEIDELTEAAP